MQIFPLRKYAQNQYTAGLLAGFTVMTSGGCFVWESPILHLLDKENYKDVLIPMTKTQISLMVSFIEIGGLFSIFPSGILADFYGRKMSIVIAGPFTLIGWAIILLTKDVFYLYLARLFQGFAMGIVFTIIPIYLAEIAEAKVRGGLTALFQIMWFTGYLFQYIIGNFLSYNNSTIVGLVVSLILFSLFFILSPESPYYFMMKKNHEEATKSLILLRGKSTVNDVEKEIKMIRECVEIDMKNKLKWSNLLKLTRIDLKIIFVVLIVALMRVASGTISISSYIKEILHTAQWQYTSEEVIMLIYGIVTIVFIIIAAFAVDFVGRRPLLIFSCLGTGISNLCLAIFFLLDAKTDESSNYYTSVQWIPAVALISYSILFAVGLGPVTQTVQSELCPTNLRALGSVILNYGNGINSFLFLYSYEMFVQLFGTSSNFFLFSGFSLAAALFTYVYVPETKGITFLEIRDFYYKKSDSLTEITKL